MLEGNKTYKPAKSGNCFFLGYFYNSEGKVFRGGEAAEYLRRIIINKDFTLQNSLSGIYSAVIIEEEKLTISGDLINFFPVYYAYAQNRWIVF